MIPPAIELRILGPTELKSGQEALGDVQWRSPKRLALLAYLVMTTADGFRRRDQIVALFWPELSQEAARSQLRKVLAGYRDSFGDDFVVTRGESELRVNGDRIWCDAVAIGQQVREQRFEDALALFRGDLLEGLHAEGTASEFEEWLDSRRRATRQLAATAAWECARASENRGDRKAAVVYARRALELMPDDEEGVRRLMVLLDAQGDRAGALRVYGDWQQRLQSEFGVEPAPETRKLARRVQDARRGESHETPPPRPLLGAAPSGKTIAARLPRRRRAGLAIGALAAVALFAGAIGWRLWTDTTRPPATIAIFPPRRIGDESAELSTALVEELTTVFARDTSIRVQVIDDRATDRAPGLYALQSAIQRQDRTLRFTVRLVRSSDGVVLWASAFDIDSASRISTARTIAVEVYAQAGSLIRRYSRAQ